MTRRILTGQVVVQRARRDERLELPRGEVLAKLQARRSTVRVTAVVLSLGIGALLLAAAMGWWS